MADEPNSGPPLEQPDTPVGDLVTAEAVAQDEISDNLVAALFALWAGFSAFYVGESVAQLGQEMARLVVAAQRAAGRITEAHLREQVRLIDFRLPSTVIVDLPRDLRYGAETADVYQRPVREVRYLESTGVSRETAIETARERLEKQALTDLQLARAVSAQQVLYRFPQATGWRRVIHPELGNVCGLCIAAADRVYQRINRMDLHPGCKCTVLPIVGGVDPGGELNADDLARIYAAAGGTGTRQLSAIRIVTKENGELGPILMPDGQEWKDPKDVRNQLSPRALKMRREQLQRQIAELEGRARISQWHQDRLEQLQSLLDAA